MLYMSPESTTLNTKLGPGLFISQHLYVQIQATFWVLTQLETYKLPGSNQETNLFMMRFLIHLVSRKMFVFKKILTLATSQRKFPL